LSLLSLDALRPLLVAETAVGAHPRHFTQLGDLVLVAAQEGDRIDVLRRRERRSPPSASRSPPPRWHASPCDPERRLPALVGTPDSLSDAVPGEDGLLSRPGP